MAGLIAAPLAVLTIAAPAHADPVEIQILGTNDFHGRLLPNRAEAGAAQFAGAVAQLESENPNTVFAAAGDLIGASTFESFIQKDKPTLDALNAAGLDVSAAGNHEFDAGYADLVNRVMAPFDATANPLGGAQWQYLAANVRKKSDGSYALPDVAASPGDSDGGTWMTNVGGVDVGFVGTVTEDLPSLVSPSGIADVVVSGIVEETNRGADALKAAGADIVVMLVHEGAATTNISSLTDGSAFARIVAGVDDDVSAIISGHTHLAYAHADPNDDTAGRPVVSAGQYGTNLNQLIFTVDPDTGSVVLNENNIVAAADVELTDPDAVAAQAEVQEIVDAAESQAEVLGAVELGKVGGGFYRARLDDGTTENRGGESTLGNLVAEVQRWATSAPESGSAQIAFMNPGGLRADMVGNNAAGYPASLTYKQAAVVQPFANTLVNMRMTGAQIKTVLEQQWQRDNNGAVPTRPFLRLGTSKGFFATYDTTRPEGDRVTGMWLDGKAIDAATAYSVTVNSFLASGGDNFREFAKGTAQRDTGKVDLQAMVDYMAANAKTAALPVSYQQNFVGATWPADKPRFYRIGQRVKVSLSSLAMTHPLDLRDGTLRIETKNARLRPAKVDNTLDALPFDESGRSNVSVHLNRRTRPGKQMLSFTGTTTDSTFGLPIEIRKALPRIKAKIQQKRVRARKTRARMTVNVTALGLGRVSGNVRIKAGGKRYDDRVRKGKVVVKLDRFKKPGLKKIRVIFRGNKFVRGGRLVIKVRVRRG